ncbi:hypothetical protein GCM10012279_57540 [Micromonospora yangpuensis]|nr:hypothetical protein GCM10012279_57540 [Micromonospora yangpuensis]
MPRVSYEEYLVAAALSFARRHRSVWSWQKWRRICRCGADLPCHARHRIPINRGHWPGEETLGADGVAHEPRSHSNRAQRWRFLPSRRSTPVEVAMSDDKPVKSLGEQVQAAEHAAARERILALAEAERVPVEETTRVVSDRRWRDAQR